MGQTNGVGSIGVGVGSSKDLWVSLSFPLLAAVVTEASVCVGIGVGTVDSTVAGNWDVSVVNAWSRLEWDAIGQWRVETTSSVQEGWVSLSLSLGVDSCHKGTENNL